jgi:hypothetical protein
VQSGLRAASVAQRTINAEGRPTSELLLAYPLINTPLVFPNAGEQYTTIVT